MTAATVAPVPDALFTALGNFIMTVTGLPESCVTRGIDNEVDMPPASPGFVNMTALFQLPLATNVESWDAIGSDPTVYNYERDTRFDIQMDAYGAASGSWAAMLSTLLRSDYGVQQLAPSCAPLYADDARMIPITDAESLYEERWNVTAVLQWNPVTTTPQTFANSLSQGLINVNREYPLT